MKNFSKNKNTILIIEKHIIIKRKVSVNILQNLLSFSMLYSFYNANFLKLYKNIKLRFNIIEVTNNINILTYNKLIKQNCKILKKYKIKL